MRVDISGAVARNRSWHAYGEFRDLLAADTGEISLLGGAGDDTTTHRITLVFPGRLGAGSFEIGRYVYGARPTGPAAFVILDRSFFASVPGGSVTIEAAEYPARPGLEPGQMNGAMTLHAVRLVAGPGGAPVETHDTIAVRVTFAAHWYHYLRPNVAMSLTGAGPQLGSSLVSFGQSTDDDHGGRLVWWDSDLDGVPGQAIPYEATQEFRLAAPAVGIFPLEPMTPVTYADPTQWPAAYSALYYRDDPRLALSAGGGGTLTITRFVAPTDAYYGEIHGTLTAPLALWVNPTTVTADTVRVTSSFAVQLWPLGGIPASSLAASPPAGAP